MNYALNYLNEIFEQREAERKELEQTIEKLKAQIK